MLLTKMQNYMLGVADDEMETVREKLLEAGFQ
jgi:hypothetical protein